MDRNDDDSTHERPRRNIRNPYDSREWSLDDPPLTLEEEPHQDSDNESTHTLPVRSTYTFHGQVSTDHGLRATIYGLAEGQRAMQRDINLLKRQLLWLIKGNQRLHRRLRGAEVGAIGRGAAAADVGEAVTRNPLNAPIASLRQLEEVNMRLMDPLYRQRLVRRLLLIKLHVKVAFLSSVGERNIEDFFWRLFQSIFDDDITVRRFFKDFCNTIFLIKHISNNISAGFAFISLWGVRSHCAKGTYVRSPSAATFRYRFRRDIGDKIAHNSGLKMLDMSHRIPRLIPAGNVTRDVYIYIFQMNPFKLKKIADMNPSENKDTI
ncbi:unnamed protein product [Dibothriocephalus latus]|uniref:Uncharacterized protein n=1 Tax=Dibothriocephalus latus TaxID=60516 RepID=A0A3P7LLH9_DIBLA|nr:unnamed protein product [Dibothriocephalus latus]